MTIDIIVRIRRSKRLHFKYGVLTLDIKDGLDEETIQKLREHINLCKGVTNARIEEIK